MISFSLIFNLLLVLYIYYFYNTQEVISSYIETKKFNFERKRFSSSFIPIWGVKKSIKKKGCVKRYYLTTTTVLMDPITMFKSKVSVVVSSYPTPTAHDH